jgi:hypothetical protein
LFFVIIEKKDKEAKGGDYGDDIEGDDRQQQLKQQQEIPDKKKDSPPVGDTQQKPGLF